MRARWDQANQRWEASVGYGKGRRWIRSRVRGEEGRQLVEARLLDLIEGPAPLPQGSLAEFLEVTWWPRTKPGLTKRTQDSYKSIVSNHFGQLEPLPLEALRLEVLQSWATRLQDAGRSEKTVRNIVGLLTGILELAANLKRVSHTEWRLVAIRETERVEEEALTADEVEAIVAAAIGTPMAGPVWAAARLGLRRNEVCGLKRPQVAMRESCAVVTIQDNRQIHGEERRLKSKRPGEKRVLHIPIEWGRQLLEFASPESIYLFLGQEGGPIHPNMVTKSMPEICRRAGVRQVTFHALRHAAAARLRASGTPETVISSILGHSSTATTAIYLDRDAELILGAFRRLGSA